MALKEILAENIRHLRVKAGLTQAQLSDRTGINTRHLSQLENRPQNITVDTIERLAKGLGVAPSALLDGGEWKPTGQLKNPSKKEIVGVKAAMRVLRSYLATINE